jgi:hypothetical protein
MKNWGFGSWNGIARNLSGHTFFISTFMLEPDNFDHHRPNVARGIFLISDEWLDDGSGAISSPWSDSNTWAQ